jgi:transcriptional regulator with XRE-family HTH domain
MARPAKVVKGKLAQAVVALREEFGESQQAFSNRLGLSLNAVQRWELNDRPNHKSILRLIELAYGRKRRDICRVLMKELTREYGSIRHILRVKMVLR